MIHTRYLWSVLAVVIAAEGLQLSEIHTLNKDVDDLAWNIAVHDFKQDNFITPDLAFIQFFKGEESSGLYSVQFNDVKYSQDGLCLRGFVGNAGNISVTYLALKLSAYKALDRTLFDRHKFFWPQPVGVGVSSRILTLAPGTKQKFNVMIPNVKGRTDAMVIVATFTGEESYSYDLPSSTIPALLGSAPNAHQDKQQKQAAAEDARESGTASSTRASSTQRFQPIGMSLSRVALDTKTGQQCRTAANAPPAFQSLPMCVDLLHEFPD